MSNLDEIIEATKELGRRYYPKEAIIHALLTKTSLLYNLEQLVYFEVDETDNVLIATQALGSLTEEEHDKVSRDIIDKSFIDLVKAYSPKLDEAFNKFIFGYEIPLDQDSILTRIVKDKLSFEGGVIENPTDVDKELFDKFGTDKIVALTIKGIGDEDKKIENVIGIIYGNMKFSGKMPVVDKTVLNPYRYLFSPIIQLIKNYEELIKNEASATIGEIVNKRIHKLRTPIIIINLALNNIKEEMDKENPDYDYIKRRFNIIAEETPKLEGYISDIGILSYIEKDLPFDKIDLISIVNDSLNCLKKLDYKINNFTNNSFIYGNYKELKEAVDNILNNCFEAIEEDRTPVQKENILTIDIHNDKDFIYLQTNNRQYIPFEIQKRLFEHGFTTKIHGTGFGLPIAKKIIQHYKGKLIVQSNETEGTTFMIKLPLYK